MKNNAHPSISTVVSSIQAELDKQGIKLSTPEFTRQGNFTICYVEGQTNKTGTYAVGVTKRMPTDKMDFFQGQKTALSRAVTSLVHKCTTK
jgi:hypothetical protein